MALVKNLTKSPFYDSYLKIYLGPGETKEVDDTLLLKYGAHIKELIDKHILRLVVGLAEAGKDIKTDDDPIPIKDSDVFLSQFNKSLKDAIYEGDLQSGLGYTPENIANKGQPNGYAELDSNAKVPIIRIPDTFKEIRIVADIAERDSLTPFVGMRVHVLDNGDGKWAEYIWTGSEWSLTGDQDTPFQGVIDWANVENKPTSSPIDIDDAVNKRHIQNTDTKLDEGGINEVTASQIKEVIRKDYPLRWYIDAFVPGSYINQAPSTNGFTAGQQVAVNDWGDVNNGNIYRVQDNDTWLLLEESYKGLGVLHLPTLIDYYYAGDTDNSWWNDNLVNKQDKVTSATEDNIATWNNSGNTKDSGKSFETTLTNNVNKVPTSSAVYIALNNHITNTSNPHNVTLEQARVQDNQIDGDIDYNNNRAINLPQPSSNGEPLVYGNDGTIWFYDTSRSKVLSIDILYMRYARNSSSITSSQFLRMINGMSTNQNSDRLFWNATLIAAIVSHKNTGASWDLQVRKNRSSTNIYKLRINTSQEYVIDNDINIDFDVGDLIQIRLNRLSGTIKYPVVQLLFRRRQ